MGIKHTNDRCSRALVALHWLTLLLLVAVCALMELRGIYPRGSVGRAAMRNGHYMLGLAVLALLPVRLALRRMGGRMPPIYLPQPIMQERSAALMHLSLYVFLLCMPILGWITLSAQGKPIPFFGLQLPALIAADKDLGRSLGIVHETIGTLGYYLIGLHAAAALLHHYWMRGQTLRRMLPRRD